MDERETTAAVAGDIVVLATDLLARGFHTTADRMLRGVVNHIINAIAGHHGLVENTGNSLGRRQTMEYFQSLNPRTPSLEDSLAAVGEVHSHFSDQHMSDAQHAEAIKATLELVDHLLNRPKVQSVPQVPKTAPAGGCSSAEA